MGQIYEEELACFPEEFRQAVHWQGSGRAEEEIVRADLWLKEGGLWIRAGRGGGQTWVHATTQKVYFFYSVRDSDVAKRTILRRALQLLSDVTDYPMACPAPSELPRPKFGLWDRIKLPKVVPHLLPSGKGHYEGAVIIGWECPGGGRHVYYRTDRGGPSLAERILKPVGSNP